MVVKTISHFQWQRKSFPSCNWQAESGMVSSKTWSMPSYLQLEGEARVCPDQDRCWYCPEDERLPKKSQEELEDTNWLPSVCERLKEQRSNWYVRAIACYNVTPNSNVKRKPGTSEQYLLIKIPPNSFVRMNKLELKQVKMQTLIWSVFHCTLLNLDDWMDTLTILTREEMGKP